MSLCTSLQNLLSARTYIRGRTRDHVWICGFNAPLATSPSIKLNSQDFSPRGLEDSATQCSVRSQADQPLRLRYSNNTGSLLSCLDFARTCNVGFSAYCSRVTPPLLLLLLLLTYCCSWYSDCLCHVHAPGKVAYTATRCLRQQQ